MIDNLALLIFGSLVVYTVFRAIKLDAVIPWFSTESEEHLPSEYRQKSKKKT